MVTATTTKTQDLQAEVTESNAPSYIVDAIITDFLELRNQTMRQPGGEALRKTLAIRRRVDAAFAQVASYW